MNSLFYLSNLRSLRFIGVFPNFKFPYYYSWARVIMLESHQIIPKLWDCSFNKCKIIKWNWILQWPLLCVNINEVEDWATNLYDASGPIREQYSDHVITLDPSEASVQGLICVNPHQHWMERRDWELWRGGGAIWLNLNIILIQFPLILAQCSVWCQLSRCQTSHSTKLSLVKL